MLNYCLSLLILFCFTLPIQAQTLIPYLGKNGKKGFSDLQGNVVIEPALDEARAFIKDNEAGVFAVKDGKRTLVLRNGEMYAAQGGGAAFMELFENPEISVPEDTLKHILVASLDDKAIFINTKTGKRYETEALLSNHRVHWLDWDKHRLQKGWKHNKALHGVVRLDKKSGGCNFLDLELNPIFDRDFAAGTVVDDDFFILATGEGQLGIGDRKGNIRTGFDYLSIEPSGRIGYFIVSKMQPTGAAEYPPVQQGEDAPIAAMEEKKMGLMDADGKYIIEPIMKKIMTAGNDYVVVQNEEGYAIMDFKGEIKFEIQESQIIHAFDNIFVLYGKEGNQIIDEKGKSIVNLEPNTSIQLMDSNQEDVYFVINTKTQKGIMDRTLKMVFQSEVDAISREIWDGERFFLPRKTQEGYSYYYGLLDKSGKEILPIEYSKINLFYPFDLIKIEKENLVGLLNLQGKTIFPLEYEDIVPVINGDTKLIFVLPKGKTIYEAYTPEGKRLMEYDIVDNLNWDEVINIRDGKHGEPAMLYAKDGKRTAIPEDWDRPKSYLSGLESPDGIMVIKQERTHYGLYDTDLNPLTPSGFYVPKTYNLPRLRHIGLVPVTGGEPTEKNEANEPISISTEQGEIADLAVEERTTHFQGTGVLNTKGEWVLGPTEGVRYQPVSYNLVLEFPLYGRDKKHPSKLHRVNHPKPASWDISAANELLNLRPFDNALVYQRQQQLDKDGMVSRCTWFTAAGEQLSEFEYLAGPSVLTNHNLVAKENKGEKAWYIVDKNLKVLSILPPLTNSPTYGQSLKWGYFSAEMDGKFGVFDSLGKKAMPFRYEELKVLGKDGFVLETKKEAGVKHYILHKIGKGTISESATPIRQRFSSETGLYFFQADEKLRATTIAVDKKGQVQYTLEDAKYDHDLRPIQNIPMAQFQNSEGKSFYVQTQTGKAYRE